MKEKKTNRKCEYFFYIFSLFIIFHIILIFSLRLYPFIDLPNHLSEATILRYYNEDGNAFSKYYSINLFFKPNIFHMIFCSLKIFPSPEFANKIFYCLYVLLLPLSILLVIKKLDGNPWFSILAFLLIYNYNVSCGLAGFSISIPFVFIFFYLIINDNKSIYKKIGLSIFLLFLFSMHIISTLYALLLYFAITFFYNRNSLKRFFIETALTIPVLTVIIAWWIKDGSGNVSTLNFLYTYYKNEYFQTLFKRFGLFMFDNYFLYEGWKGPFVAFFFSLFIILPSFFIFKKKELYKKNMPLWVFMGTAFLSFLLLPDRIPDNWCLYERFSVLLLLSIIILNSLLYSKKSIKILILIICFASFLHFILWSSYFISFQKENHTFNKNLFPKNQRDKTLAGLIYDNKFRGKPIYLHFPNYYIIWSRGIAATMIVDYRFGVIRRKVGKDILPSYLDMVLKGVEEDNADYILIRGKIPDILTIKRIKSQGVWTLCYP